MSAEALVGVGTSPTQAVLRAVEEIRAGFPSTTWTSDGSGGAHVLVDDVPLGQPFAQDCTWIGFHITALCPYADVYPHYVRGDLAFADGRALAVPLHGGNAFPPGAGTASRVAVMVSRISRRRDTASMLETPLLKLLKVVQCLKSL